MQPIVFNSIIYFTSLYKDRWRSNSSTAAIRLTVLNPNVHSTFFVQKSMMLLQFQLRHVTDFLQSQPLLYFFHILISVTPAVPPLSYNWLSPIPTPTQSFLYKDWWSSSSSIPALRLIVFNSSTYFTSVVQKLVILQQLLTCYMTDYFQFQHWFYLFCTKIGDLSAAPPAPFDQLSLITTSTPSFLYKNRWCSSSSTYTIRLIVFKVNKDSTYLVPRSMIF